jgi:hypothetical protein
VNPEDFVPIEGKPNHWLAPDGAIYVTRQGQSIEEFLAELAAEEEG